MNSKVDYFAEMNDEVKSENPRQTKTFIDKNGQDRPSEKGFTYSRMRQL